VNITILGAGAWGTALGIALSERHAVTLWARDPAQRAELAGDRRSRYLREVPLPAAVAVADDAPAAIRADTLTPPGTGAAPRYLQCPLAPFNDTTQTNVCAGI
jgi:glycerol-3-phosphate dehydrogenase